MLGDYFGEIGCGRLNTRRFLLLWLVLVAVFVLFGILIGASLGIAEHIIGGDLRSAQTMLRERFALPAILAVAAFFIFFAFAKLNIIAKRARDTGLPGWLTAIIIAGLIGGSSQVVDHSSAGGIGFLLIIVLAFIPTNAFRKTT